MPAILAIAEDNVMGILITLNFMAFGQESLIDIFRFYGKALYEVYFDSRHTWYSTEVRNALYIENEDNV